jgi:hypothetical protein
MRAHWYTRSDSFGHRWRIGVCTPEDCPRDDRGGVTMLDDDFATTIFDRCEIWLNVMKGPRTYLPSLIHEFQHVEQHNRGLYEGEQLRSSMHAAIEASAVMAARLPRKPPPAFEED